MVNGARLVGPANRRLDHRTSGRGLVGFFIDWASSIAVIVSLLLMSSVPRRAGERRLLDELAEGWNYISWIFT